MTSDHELSGDHGAQLSMVGVPAEGDMFRDKRSGTIGCVVRVRVEPRRTWITVRRNGTTTDMPLEDFDRYWGRSHADGSPR
jgi:hypothetical protein